MVEDVLLTEDWEHWYWKMCLQSRINVGNFLSSNRLKASFCLAAEAFFQTQLFSPTSLETSVPHLVNLTEMRGVLTFYDEGRLRERVDA